MLRHPLLALALASAAMAGPPADLAGLLEPIRAEHGVPALAAAISQGGELVALGAVGQRRQGAPALVTTGDAFHYGSNGKSVTATLVARLVEKGLLSWDRTLAELFPERGDDELHPDYRSVTLTQLLSHTAGLPANPSQALMMRMFTEEATPETQRSWVASEALTAPAPVPPGTKWSYSNVGYTLAGMACEQAAGVSFEQLIAAEVFEPLGMEGVGFGAPPGDDAPWGHLVMPEGMPQAGERVAIPPQTPGADNPPGIAPAGTLHGPPASWMRYLQAHLGHGPPGFLTRESLRRLHAPVVDAQGGLRYALGWLVKPGGDLVFHDGSNNKWYAFTALQPSQDRAVMVVTNQGLGGGHGAANGAFQAVLTWTAPEE